MLINHFEEQLTFVQYLKQMWCNILNIYGEILNIYDAGTIWRNLLDNPLTHLLTPEGVKIIIIIIIIIFIIIIIIIIVINHQHHHHYHNHRQHHGHGHHLDMSK